MPANIVKSFAEKTGKSESEVEKLWDKAKASVDKPESDPSYYPNVTSILKKMLGLNEGYECPNCQRIDDFIVEGNAEYVECSHCGYIVTNDQLSTLKTEEVAASTSSDIAVVPGGGSVTKRVLPDGKHGDFDYFDVDYANFSTASQARVMRQRYNFTDQRVNDYMRQNNYSRPFYVKHKDHMVKVGKIY
jgi:Zn ribbon nucleic-acid-binding protein